MFKRKYHTPGTAPATLIAPEGEVGKPVITLIDYDKDHFEQRVVENIEEVFGCRDNRHVSWINIDGLGDVEVFHKLGEHFGLHPLALEDVLNVGQRPKLEQYSDHYFIIAQMIFDDSDGKEINSEQVSIFLKNNVLITIQQDPTRDVFDGLRNRLRNGRGFARSMGHDYLAYALMDAMVDHYFPVLERIGDAVEDLETELLENPSRSCLTTLHDLKRSLLYLRRVSWPEREVLNSLMRDESGLVSQETKVFLRDCYDHTIQIMDVIESYRDLTTGMMDLYLSSLGMRTNEIMRVLTVVTSIFIPLTFIAGVYGMNFQNMPELRTRDGYFIVLGLMGAIGLGMLYFFRRKKWL